MPIGSRETGKTYNVLQRLRNSLNKGVRNYLEGLSPETNPKFRSKDGERLEDLLFRVLRDTAKQIVCTG